MQKFLIEVETKLNLQKAKVNAAAQKYINTQLPVAAISAPHQRLIYKSEFSFSKLPLTEQLQIWDFIWNNSQWFETKNQSLYFVQHKLTELDFKTLWPVLSVWINEVDNWAHSDSLSSFFAKLSEQNSKTVYAKLKKWNCSKNLWERRQSLVSLFYYARTRKEFFSFEECIALIENLIADKEYYVQKGLGWSLRESFQVYKKPTMQFIKQNCTDLSSTAFSAATEKYMASDKQILLDLRKLNRSNTIK